MSDASAPPQARAQFLRYIVVGLSATGIHFAILNLLVELFAAPGLLATSVGLVVASVFNYLLQHAWVFQAQHRRHREAAPTYALVTGLALVLNMIVFSVASAALTLPMVQNLMALAPLPEVLALRLDHNVAQGVATAAVFLFNFWANRRFTFEADQPAASVVADVKAANPETEGVG